MKKITWEDMDFICLIEYGDTFMNFWVYEIVGHEQNFFGKFNIPIYEKKGVDSSVDTTKKLGDAETYMDGTIKWDGCSHVYFGEEGYIHICGGRKWRSHIEVCKRLFDLAAQYFNEEHQKEYFYKEFNAIDHD